MRDLSVIMPARKEEWLKLSVEDVLRAIRADTEVIVVCDGSWPVIGLEQHPRVQIVYVPEAIGQRAATNIGAKISTARYVMKLDAHSSMAEGFDATLIDAAKEVGDDCTQIPAQKHLHVYDRICEGCGKRTDQSPVLKVCATCKGTSWTREVVWKPRESPTSTSWRLDRQLHFAYHTAKHQVGDLCDVMTSLGACFFVGRERYWELGGFDEAAGIWGQFGCEWALKNWLSGGRHIVNKRTWFAHFFRVGGHGFPYELTSQQQNAAREYSQQLWFHNAWQGQVKPLRWLVEKFSPLPGWGQDQINGLPAHLERESGASAGSAERERSARQHRVTHDRSSAPTKGAVWYTDNRAPADIRTAALGQLKRGLNGHALVTVGLEPEPGIDLVLPLQRGYLAMFMQILAGLEALDTDIAFLVEHDCLYDTSHFDFTPPRDDCYWYDTNTWKVDAETGRAITYITKQTSGLCANRQLLVEHYRKRVDRVKRDGFSRRMGFEPGSHRRKERIDDVPSDTWRSAVPIIDIRHSANLTSTRWSQAEFRDQRNCQGWQEAAKVPGWKYDTVADLLMPKTFA